VTGKVVVVVAASAIGAEVAMKIVAEKRAALLKYDIIHSPAQSSDENVRE
jgi:hypothetical protein